MIVLTNYPNLGDLKNRNLFFHILQAGNLKSVLLGQTQGVSRGILPLDALGKNPFPASPASRSAAGIPFHMAHHMAFPPHSPTSLLQISCLSLSFIEPCNHTRPTRVIQTELPISKSSTRFYLFERERESMSTSRGAADRGRGRSRLPAEQGA